MSAAPVIRAAGVGKKFSRTLSRMMLNATRDLGRSMLGLDRRAGELRPGEFWALDDIHLDVLPGERVGLVGRNGSGKSTLLKLLNGILIPDRGEILIRGRTGALIEVGAGFHPLLTGRENIYVNGAILGLSQAEIRRRFDEIVAFAELEHFLDSPVKFYSSGMYVRLGFAVAVHAEIEILLIDEVLAVGDFTFQRKCFEKLDALAARGTTMIVVSHSLALIERLCTRALVLDRGRPVFLGETTAASAAYYRSLAREGHPSSAAGGLVHKDVGSGAVVLSAFSVLDRDRRRSGSVVCGDEVVFALEVTAPGGDRAELPRLAILVLQDETEEVVANIQTPPAFLQETVLAGRASFTCRLPTFNLAPGRYRFLVKIGGDGDQLFDVAVIPEPLEVVWSREVVENMSHRGRVFLPGQWRVTPREPAKA